MYHSFSLGPSTFGQPQPGPLYTQSITFPTAESPRWSRQQALDKTAARVEASRFTSKTRWVFILRRMSKGNHPGGLPTEIVEQYTSYWRSIIVWTANKTGVFRWRGCREASRKYTYFLLEFTTHAALQIASNRDPFWTNFALRINCSDTQ